jgi:hypothetical protein
LNSRRPRGDGMQLERRLLHRKSQRAPGANAARERPHVLES